MRILSVDDSAATRMFIKKAIDVLDFDFLEAGDGKEGLEVLERENGRIDLILLDRHMPVMDGMMMLESVKSDDRYKHIPVTMVTVETERDEIHKAIEKGARNYLIKPFSQEKLIGKIMEGLNMSL
jgi:two-component system chemotaxis response regulator CheY